MDSDFRDNGWFSKLPYWPKFQKWHIYSLSNPGAWNSEFSPYGQRFPRYCPLFKIFIFGQEFQKLHIYSLSTLRGWNWGYFCSSGSGFRDTGHFSKLPYLGMKLGHWPKFHKLHMYTFFLPQGVESELVFALRATVSEIRANFQNCYIWAWNILYNPITK